MSDGHFDPRYPHKTATVEVTRGFCDYETGYRFIGVADDPELSAFRDKHGSSTDRRIFFSEFELADRRDLGPLVDAIVGGDDGQ